MSRLRENTTKTLYFGGPILTMEDPVPRHALLEQGGKILAVGSLEELTVLAGDCRQVDLQGHCLLPGFIDPHSHFTTLGTALTSCDLTGSASPGEIVDRLRRFLQQHPPADGGWVVGFGYDNNLLPGAAHPTRQLLDQVSYTVPVLISHASGHMGAANSAALAAMGLTAATPDPEGGLYGRTADGQLSGYMEERAFTAAGAAVPPPAADLLVGSLLRGQEIYLQNGITTAQDGMTGQKELALLRLLAERQQLKLDVVGYVDLANFPDLLAQTPAYSGGYRHHLRLGGYKIFLDGSPQGRTAWLSAPYLGGDGHYCGYPIHTDEQVRRLVQKSLDDGRQLLCHCNGDAASQQYIEAFQAVLGQKSCPTRPVMIHAQTVRDDQLAQMAPLGMIASFFTAHTYYWGDVHLKNLGPARAGHITPAVSAIENGVVYTFHQDTPVLPPDMIDTLWCAVNRTTRAGVVLGPDQKLSTYQALEGITKNAAYQYFEERQKGTLAPGKLADMVILSQDPLQLPGDELRRLQVLATCKEGRWVYQKH
ncbi:amidohydrolase [Neobittarella massiliensis]